jgi:hypothetical protein
MPGAQLEALDLVAAPSPVASHPPPRTWTPRYFPAWFSMIGGVWLFASAFLLPRGYNAFTNAWVIGILMSSIGSATFTGSDLRFVDAALALWLFASAFMLEHHHPFTIWHDALLGIVVFVASMTPPRRTVNAIRASAPAP